jgi:TonB family protein
MRKQVRLLAIVGVIAFVAVSAAVHFTVGSTVATFFPSWRYEPAPDQAISIISLSRNVRDTKPDPTPVPTAPPKIVLRTSTHLAPIKYREMTRFDTVVLGSIHAPARRKSNLFVSGPKLDKPGTLDAPGASNDAQPTPSPGSAGAKRDSGGPNDELTASEWGDDNPPRVLHLAPLALATAPPQSVRIEVEVGPDGDVVSARIVQSSGDAGFDAAALDAARKTVFAPATANGLPVHGTIVLEYPATSGST